MLEKKLVSMHQPNVTFVMIKADAIRNKVSDSIVSMIESNGFIPVMWMDKKIFKLADIQIEDLYKHNIGKSYWSELYNSIALGCRPMIFEYPFYDVHAWEKMRSLVGSTNARKAEENTIRHKFGGHNYDENCPPADNAIHASDSLASVIREIRIVFPSCTIINSCNHSEFNLDDLKYTDSLVEA